MILLTVTAVAGMEVVLLAWLISSRLIHDDCRIPWERLAYQFVTGFVRPAVDETCGRLAGSVGGEVGFVMVRSSPRISWTRDA